MALSQVRIVGIGKEMPGEPITNARMLSYCNLGPDITTEWIERKIGTWESINHVLAVVVASCDGAPLLSSGGLY